MFNHLYFFECQLLIVLFPTCKEMIINIELLSNFISTDFCLIKFPWHKRSTPFSLNCTILLLSILECLRKKSKINFTLPLFPYSDYNLDCMPPHGYIHVLSLTENITEFEKAVHRQKISGNIDTPEGGFDAMLQAAVCEVRRFTLLSVC